MKRSKARKRKAVEKEAPTEGILAIEAGSAVVSDNRMMTLRVFLIIILYMDIIINFKVDLSKVTGAVLPRSPLERATLQMHLQSYLETKHDIFAKTNSEVVIAHL